MLPVELLRPYSQATSNFGIPADRDKEIPSLLGLAVHPIGLISEVQFDVSGVDGGCRLYIIAVPDNRMKRLAINLKTAKALGLEVPAALLARADEVIE